MRRSGSDCFGISVLPPLLQRAPKGGRMAGKRKRTSRFTAINFRVGSDLRTASLVRTIPKDRDEIERVSDDGSSDDEVSAKDKRAVSRDGLRDRAWHSVVAVALYLLVGNSAVWSGAGHDARKLRRKWPAKQWTGLPSKPIEANVAALAKLWNRNGRAQGWVMLARSYTSLEIH